MTRWLTLVPLMAAAPATAADPAPPRDGKALYAEMCSSCHMVTGAGVRGQQPPLRANKVVMGDPRALVRLVLNGTEGTPEVRRRFPNEMPPFESLGDAEIATILTYVRSSFGNKAGAITPAQVAAERAGR